jgi:hypothetical protein
MTTHKFAGRAWATEIVCCQYFRNILFHEIKSLDMTPLTPCRLLDEHINQRSRVPAVASSSEIFEPTSQILAQLYTNLFSDRQTQGQNTVCTVTRIQTVPE